MFLPFLENQPALKFETGGNSVLKLDNLSIFSGMEFYFADKSWFGKRVNIDMSKAKIIRNGDRSYLEFSKNIDSDFSCDLKISWSPRTCDIEMSYEIPSGSPYVYGVIDLFLNKNLFPSKGRFSEGKDSLGETLEQSVLDFKNDLGIFKFTLKSSDNKTAPWCIRDTRNQKWRPENLQTTDILNCTRTLPPVKRQIIKMTLEYQPSQNASALVMARTSLLLLQKLKEKKVPHDDMIKLDALEKKFESAISGGSVDSIPDTCSEVNSISKKLSAELSSYVGNGIIIPAPQSLVPVNGRFTLGADISIVIGSGASAEIAKSASILASEIQRVYGLKLRVTGGDNLPDGNCINLSIDSEVLPGKTEAYTLSVTPDCVDIKGVDARGLFYGTQSFFQVLEKDDALNISAKCATVRDWPDIPFRGMMIEMGGQDSFDWINRTLEMLAMHKFNVIVFGQTGDHNIKWDSHPELALKNALTAKQLRAFAAKSRAFFLEPVPLIQSIGHNTSVLKAHPELADSTDPKNLGNAFCLADPAVKKLLADLFNECIDIYKPKYFHIGGDEAYPIGTNPRCKGKAPAELVAEHVKWCSDYIKSKGVKNIMMWHDMLLDRKAWPSDIPAHSASPAGVFTALIHPAVQNLPKDIIINYWSYHETGRIPAVPYFQQFGYRLLCCGWFDDKNSYDLSAAASDYNAMGILDTNWGYCALKNQMSLVSVENAWTVNNPTFDNLPYDPVKRLQADMLPALVSNYAGTSSSPLAIESKCNIFMNDFIHHDPTVKGFLLAPEGCQRLGDLNFRMIPETSKGLLASLNLASPEKTKNVVAVANRGVAEGIPDRVSGINVGKTAKAIAFLHTYIPGVTGRKSIVANYVVRYKDGKTCSAPVAKQENITSLSMSFVLKEHKKRGAGSVPDAKRVWMMTDKGDELNFQIFEWKNPMPEKEIESFDIVIDPKAGDALLALLAVSVID